jgi:hypothetical protein
LFRYNRSKIGIFGVKRWDFLRGGIIYGISVNLQARAIHASTPCPPENLCTKRYLTWHNFNWDIFRAGDKIACSCRFTFILRMAFLYILKKIIARMGL